MNTCLLNPIILAIVNVSLFSSFLFCEATKAEMNAEKASKGDRVTFFCDQIAARDSGESIPATVAWVPQRQTNIAIIAWESNYIPAWDAQRRCETVSPKFQTFYEDGRLHYLTNGVNQGYPIICATVQQGQVCTGDDQLFQVKPSSEPQEILLGLNQLLAGKSSQPLYQSSSQQIYVSVEDLLKLAPGLDN